MKTIKVEYIPETEYLPVRLKVSAYGKTLKVNRDKSMTYEQQELFVAHNFIKEQLGLSGVFVLGRVKHGVLVAIRLTEHNYIEVKSG